MFLVFFSFQISWIFACGLSDSLEKYCPALFFTSFSLFYRKRHMQKTHWHPLHFFVRIWNKRNLLSSLLSKINSMGNFDMNNNAVIILSLHNRRYSYSPTALGQETLQHGFFCCCCEANAGNFLAKLKHKGIPVVIKKTLGKAGRPNSKNYGLKTATKPKEETRSNLETSKFNCVKMSIFETFLYHFILLIFFTCVYL